MLPLSAAVARRVGLGPLRHLRVTGSTNDDLVEEARRGITEACVLVADHQTAGRGRLGRRWRDIGPIDNAEAGSLLVSLRFGSPIAAAAQRVAAVSAAALSAVKHHAAGTPGVMRNSVAESAVDRGVSQPAVKHHAAGTPGVTRNSVAESAVDCGVSQPAGTKFGARGESDDAFQGQRFVSVLSKWPNDLVVESSSVSGKLAGVLAETVDGDRPIVVVGLGMNLKPIPHERDAVSLSEIGVKVSRDELLATMLEALPGYLLRPGRARADLCAASATLGSEVRVEQADGTVFTGRAAAIDSRGCLVVETVTGSRTVEAADVHHLRPGS